ncbi:type II/IV secretion system ATPase subunit [Archaeoglobus sp.]
MNIPIYYQKLLEIYERFKIPLIDSSIPENYELVEEYWIVPNFTLIQIRRNVDTLEKVYWIIEPQIAKNELELLSILFDDLRKKVVLEEIVPSEEEKIRIVLSALREILDEYGLKLRSEFTLKILYYLMRDFFGFGAIDPFLIDPNLEDISCDGYNIPIYVFHRKHGSMKTNVSFRQEELDHLVLLLGQKSGKHISYANPLVDATLPDGSRIQITYGTDVSTRGSSFTIRRFRAEPFTPIDLMSYGTFNAGLLAYYWLLIENKMNVMVIGETAAGKTTSLNALLMFIPPEAKVVSIEDTREIQLYHENWIAEVTRSGVEGQEIDMYDLLRAALRQRPDYIVVGEVRGREAMTLFQAMSTGHAGYATFHAGDVNQLIYRLENPPLNVPRVMIQFLDSIAVQFMWSFRGVRKRRVREIVEVVGLEAESKELLINKVFQWDPVEDSYVQLADSKKLEKIAIMQGVDVVDVIDELRRRKEFLELLHQKGIRDYREVTKHIHMYYRNPEKAFEVLRE